MIVLHCTVLYSLLIWYILVITDDCSSDLSHSVSLSELAHGERPNISLKLVSSFRLLLALGPSLPAGLEACRAVACKHKILIRTIVSSESVLTLARMWKKTA